MCEVLVCWDGVSVVPLDAKLLWRSSVGDLVVAAYSCVECVGPLVLGFVRAHANTKVLTHTGDLRPGPSWCVVSEPASDG